MSRLPWVIIPVLLSALNSSAQKATAIVENRGQWPDHVLYRAQINGGYVYFEQDGLTYDFYDAGQVADRHAAHAGEEPTHPDEKFRHHAYWVHFEDALPTTSLTSDERLSHHYNFFIGKDKSKWASRVPCFNEVRYNGVYPGIDYSFRASGGQLKLDIHVEAGADPALIEFYYEGVDNIRLAKRGLVLTTSVNEIVETHPKTWYANGQPLNTEYDREGNRVSFEFTEGIEPDKSFTIDPLIFSTYSGSFSDNFGYTASFDDEGFLYSGSSAFGNSYPTTTGAYQTEWMGGDGLGTGTDMALTKYDTTGTQLIYSSYLGGENDDLPHSLVVNDQDELLVLGTSSSPDFPITITGNEFQGGSQFTPSSIGVDYVNGCDIVISRLSTDGGDLLASRYWSNGETNAGLNTTPAFKYNYADEIRGEIDIGPDSSVYVGSAYINESGNSNGVILKFSPTLESVEWAYEVSSNNSVAVYSIDFGLNDEIIFCGGVNAEGLNSVTPAGYQTTFAGGDADGFISILDESSGSPTLLYGTYFGSDAYDQFYLVEYDTQGFPHAYGQTRSGGTELIDNVEYSVSNSGMLLSKFNPTLQNVVWSTKFGTSDNKPNLSPTAFLVDLCNRIYLSGWGGTTNTSQNPNTNLTTGLPVTPDAFQETTDGSDFYLMILDTDANEFLYGSFFGGGQSAEHVDGGTSRFDRSGKIYQSVCAGCLGNSDFPIEPGDAWSPTNNSTNCNNAVFKFDFGLPLTIANFQAEDVCLPDEVEFDNLSDIEGNNAEIIWSFGDGEGSSELEPTHFFDEPGAYEVQLIINDTASCNLTDTISKTVNVHSELSLEVSDDEISCDSLAFTLVANSGGSASEYTWASDPGFQNEISVNPVDSVVTVSPDAAQYYYSMVDNGLCTRIDSVFVSPAPQASLQANNTELCQGDTATLTLENLMPGVPIGSYQWSPEDVIVNGQGTSEVEITGEGSFEVSVEAMSESGCQVEQSIPINYYPIALSVPNDTVLCEVSQLILNAETEGTAQSILWADDPEFSNLLNPGGEAMITVEPAQPTTYYTQVENGPCSLVDSVQVALFNLNLSGTDQFICRGDTAQLAVVSSIPLPGLHIDWQPDSLVISGQNTGSITTSPQETTDFEVSVTDETGCEAMVEIELEVSALGDSIDASAVPPSISGNESSTLTAFPEDDLFFYQWTPPQWLENPQSAQTIASPPETTTYSVSITDSGVSGSCQKSDSVTVTVYDLVCGPPNIFVPNSFTPNGDGDNDVLYVRGRNLNAVHLEIYNRWGELVFETEDQDEGWDGTFKGKDADPAVFVYHLEAGCIDGQEYFEKGNISLIR